VNRISRKIVEDVDPVGGGAGIYPLKQVVLTIAVDATLMTAGRMRGRRDTRWPEPDY
jgi:hypothetical protein